MKLTVGLIDGRTLLFEGTYEELVKAGEECVARFGNLIASAADAAQLQPSMPIAVRAGTSSRRWTEQTARRLWGILYGEQAKLVKYLVQRGGKAKYAEVGKYLGYEAQHLSGVLSSITRNAQAATGDRLARLVDWRIPEDGKREYYVDPDALPFLAEIVQQQT